MAETVATARYARLPAPFGKDTVSAFDQILAEGNNMKLVAINENSPRTSGRRPQASDETTERRWPKNGDKLFADGFRALERGDFRKARRSFDEFSRRFGDFEPGLLVTAAIVRDELDIHDLNSDQELVPAEAIFHSVTSLTEQRAETSVPE